MHSRMADSHTCHGGNHDRAPCTCSLGNVSDASILASFSAATMAAADVSLSSCRTVTVFVTTATSTCRTPCSFFRQFSITGTSIGQQMPAQYIFVVINASSSICELLGLPAPSRRPRRSLCSSPTPPAGLAGLQQPRVQLAPRHACATDDIIAAIGPCDTNSIPPLASSECPGQHGEIGWWSSPVEESR